MSNHAEQAVTYFQNGHNCAQAVLAGCSDPTRLPYETALQMTLAFGGGMGRKGHVCGALTGALMALGVGLNPADAKSPAAKEQAAVLAQELLARFAAKYGSINCRELTGFDLSAPDGHKKAAEAGVFKDKCRLYVQDAALMVEELLAGAK